ncbi:MAG: YigZ family protein [Ignavibacteria bacterium]|nr:YigZ family protein [Ignavibacteria bacterium]
MQTTDNYLTIEEHASTELKINKSRFIADAYPVNSSEEADERLNSVRKKYYDARHHPFSFILQDTNRFRYNDDGEPAGSSGKPIYDVINKYNLRNVIVIVTRYFGGVKLGVGGLKRAYFDTAEECLKLCKIKEILITKTVRLRFSYKFIGHVMKYLERSKISIKENNSGETVEIICDVRLGILDDMRKELTEITNGSIEIV